jgi:hypothetical protein
MKKLTKSLNRASGQTLASELLILPDGQVLVHNLTPAFARLLAELNPDCRQIVSRTRPRSVTARQATPIRNTHHAPAFAALRRGKSRPTPP